jgi:hypothetical protein
MADVRSLALHREIARRIRAEPGLLTAVRQRVAEWRRASSVSSHYVTTWSGLLDGPEDVLLATLERDDEAATALRQASPFLGIIDARQRWQIWREANREEPR